MAGILSAMSLVLPYWSKIEQSANLELTFGLWGTCVAVHPNMTADIASAGVTVDANVLYENVTCGSYFTSQIVVMQCDANAPSWRCRHIHHDPDDDLCTADKPMDMLSDQVSSEIEVNWLSFLHRACGGQGKGSIAIAIISSIFAGMSLALLVVGITCASIESSLVRYGAIAAACTALWQVALAFSWYVETQVIYTNAMYMGTSFYLNIGSLVIHFIAFLAAESHRGLEREAEMLLEEDQDPSVDSNIDKQKMVSDSVEIEITSKTKLIAV